MGLGPSKEKIKRILENSIENQNIANQANSTIGYKFIQREEIEFMEDQSRTMSTGYNSFEQDLTFTDTLFIPDLDSEKSLISYRKSLTYPFTTVGGLKSVFRGKEEIHTCFLIDTNVVVTLACNLRRNGEKATKVTTTFSPDPVKPENIHFELEKKQNKKNKKKDNKKNDKKENDNIDRATIDSKEEKKNIGGDSELAVLLYDGNLISEWMGVIGVNNGGDENMCGISCREIGEIGEIYKKNITSSNVSKASDSYMNIEEEKQNEIGPLLVEVNVTQSNLYFSAFQAAVEDEEKGNQNKHWDYKSCFGSPIYIKDANNGAYAIAIVDNKYNFHYFTKENITFLCEMLNKGKLLRKKVHKCIDEENLFKIDLSRNDLGPLDIRYLTDFDLKNLRILDLSSNSIKPQGAFHLSHAKFTKLESLNLNFNEIGDEGLAHIAYGPFRKLNYLYLFHNNISKDGISHLVKAEFVPNLIILSLSENPNIGNGGVKIIKEYKRWEKLNTLNLNGTGLTDEALTYFCQASMPQLRTLNILGNRFSEQAQSAIHGLRMDNIRVNYRTEEERRKAKEKLRRQKEREEKQKLKRENKNTDSKEGEIDNNINDDLIDKNAETKKD